MRVIAGRARGQKLKSPEGLGTRPTTDRIKESLFNIIQNDLYDAAFLDLFAGTGAMGIEALSRGAQKAVFVEIEKKNIEIIHENLTSTKLMENAEVLHKDVLSTIKGLYERDMKFDIIFMDPPYNKGYNIEVIHQITQYDILNDEGILIIERAAEDIIPKDISLKIFKERNYGSTTMTFLTKEV